MQRYLETRTITSTSKTVGADLAQHLLTRQHLGKTVVICDKPVIFMSVVRKYWFRLARNLQKERSSTLNAEKILQLTHDITHMQHMEFSAKTASDHPGATVFFLTPEQIVKLPTSCFSLYILEAPMTEQLIRIIEQLPNASLVVDYSHDPILRHAPLLPKQRLEQLVPQTWEKIERFFTAYNIDMRNLAEHLHDAGIINEALDTLLGVSSQFMRVADEFLEALRLAQPFTAASTQQQLYDMVAVLNRRVYALTPGTLSQQFLQTLSDDNADTLHDAANENLTLALAV